MVELSFDMLMALQTKRVNWTILETCCTGLGPGMNFTAQTLPPFVADFSKVSVAVKDQVPKEASQEAYNVLKVIYTYFDSLNLEEDLAGAHPNFKDAKALMLAYYTLNDLLLGKVVGERENNKESQALQTVLEDLAKDTYFNVNFDLLMNTVYKKGLDIDREDIIEDSRDLFKEQLKNLDRPKEVPPPPAPEPTAQQAPAAPEQPQPETAQPTTETAPNPQPEPAQPAPQEPTPPPTPQEPQPPATSLTPPAPLEPQQEPEPAPIVELPPTQPQEEPTPPAPMPPPQEQPQPTDQSMPQPAAEQPQTAQPPAEALPVEQQPLPEQPAPAPPIGEAEAKPPEQKRSFGRRMRKAILGY